jgi:hypothetical protein
MHKEVRRGTRIQSLISSGVQNGSVGWPPVYEAFGSSFCRMGKRAEAFGWRGPDQASDEFHLSASVRPKKQRRSDPPPSGYVH